MAQYTFKRSNGEPLTIEMTIDLDKLAEECAEVIARRGVKKITKAGGAIVATVVEQGAN
jgi:hypothetical protein